MEQAVSVIKAGLQCKNETAPEGRISARWQTRPDPDPQLPLCYVLPAPRRVNCRVRVRMNEEIGAILAFWFGPLDESGMPFENRNRLWFRGSADTDRNCAERFGALVDSALAGELEAWERGDSGLVALVLLLDQFTRNIYRGTARAFCGDPRALDIARRAVAAGRYPRLPASHRMFLLMPLMHAEDPDAQEQCVALFEELAAVTGDPQLASSLRYARAHRDVVFRFGRFPHRNAPLGRQSTPEELDYMETHGGF
jgi:uncharacterized protein (DUF924 family)